MIEVFQGSAVENGRCSPAIIRDLHLAKTSLENTFNSLFTAFWKNVPVLVKLLTYEGQCHAMLG